MANKKLRALWIALSFVVLPSSAWCQPKGEPEQIIRLLIHDHQPFLTEHPTSLDFGRTETAARYFDESVVELFREETRLQKGHPGEECGRDSDAVYDAQDGDEEKVVQIIAAKSGGGTFSVTLTSGADAAQTFVYHLKNTSAGWRIDDIEYPDKRTLRATLRLAAKECVRRAPRKRSR